MWRQKKKAYIVAFSSEQILAKKPEVGGENSVERALKMNEVCIPNTTAEVVFFNKSVMGLFIPTNCDLLFNLIDASSQPLASISRLEMALV